MKTIRVLFLGWCLVFSLTGYSQELDNLEYCHESIQLRNIFFLTENTKIGVSMDLKSVFLLRDGNVIRDTLIIRNDMLQSVTFVDVNKAALNFLNFTYLVEVSANKIQIEDTIDYRQIGFGADGVFGTDLITRFKPVSKKKRHINYIHELRTEDESITQITDNYPEIVRKSYSNQLIGTVFFDKDDPLIYTTLEGAGKFCIYNYASKKRQVFTLQGVATKEHSWYVFYDAKTDQLHPIKFGKDGQNEVYSFDPQTQEMTPLMAVSFKPLTIIGGKMHKRSVQEGDKGKLLCHYLVPLSSEKQGGTVILDAVEVSSN